MASTPSAESDVTFCVRWIVASLLPIMWSTRIGAEVMKPLATPVIGGMASSLIHIVDCNAGDLRVVARAGMEQAE